MLGNESERIGAQKCFHVLLRTAADDCNIHVRLLAEPVQQGFNAGIRRRRPGVKFDFAQRAVVVQEESDPFTGRDSPSDLLARLSNRVFFYDLTREPLQYLIRSHFRFQL